MAETQLKGIFAASPHEQATIGGMLYWSGPWPAEVYQLEAEHFSNEHCGKLYMAIDEIRGDVGPIDVVDLRRKAHELGYPYLDSDILQLLDDVPPACNLGHWAGVTTAGWRQRELKRSLGYALEMGQDVVTTAAEVQRALSAIDVSGDTGLVHVSKPLGGVLRGLVHEADNPQEITTTRTGIEAFDRKVKLGLGQLTIIAGRPSMGKSSLAGNIAAHCGKIVKGGVVALFSLEMDTASIIKRLMSSESKSTPDELPGKAQRGELMETCNTLHGMNLYLDDRPGLSVDSIRAALARFKQISLVIVDYLQLTKMDSKLERHDLRVGAATKALKALSKDYGCHVIALSQLNRNVEQRRPPRPQMSDLRDSGNIEEDADNVLLLYRAAYYDTEQPRNVAEIIIGKQRNGDTGTVRVSWDGSTQTFGEL